MWLVTILILHENKKHNEVSQKKITTSVFKVTSTFLLTSIKLSTMDAIIDYDSSMYKIFMIFSLQFALKGSL